MNTSIENPQAELGVVGLGVMGRNLALNAADHAFSVVAFDLAEQARRRLAEESGGRVACADSLDSFVRSIKPPRRVLVMVPAGAPTDAAVASLAQRLSGGDVVIDGGNAHWRDTERRQGDLARLGIALIGCGVSGGEEGARRGPSLMAGGSREAWRLLEPILTSIAAKVDAKTGRPIDPSRASAAAVESCAALVGPAGSGHFVKMVHNGIEYADMQLIAETWWFMKHALGMTESDAADAFAEWNDGPLASYLIEITADILRQRDPATGRPFVDVVLDVAGQKGTGVWTSIAALELGYPAPTIAEAVFARAASADRDARLAASEVFQIRPHSPLSRAEWLPRLRDALLCAKISAYAQGFGLLAYASTAFHWSLDLAAIARIWRAGCIIRADLLHVFSRAFDADPSLANLALAPDLAAIIRKRHEAWRAVVAQSATRGLPSPALASALAWHDAMRSAPLPTILIQAQRDYFGAHTYERIDRPRGQRFHLDWHDQLRPEREVR